MSTNNVDWAAEVQTAVLAMKEEGQKAYTFMKQEAPEVAREYLRWRVVDSSIDAALALGAALLLVWFGFYAWKKEKADRGCDLSWGMAAFVAGTFGAFLVAVAIHNCMPAVKALVAPRIVILEGIKEVVR